MPRAAGRSTSSTSTTPTWRRVIDISLDGTFHCAQATLPGMIAKGWGRIITLGGISWHAGFKRRAHNLTGKSGLTGLTRALAVEFGDRGITANVIAPGAVATVAACVRRCARRQDRPCRPFPASAHVEEIASVALFLAHPEQGYLTGQVIHVNGGGVSGNVSVGVPRTPHLRLSRYRPTRSGTCASRTRR